MNPLVIRILNNPSAHQVNRAEKMSRSVDVHVANINKKLEQGANGSIKDRNGALERGYGNGRKQND
jgi:DNA-binding response OmpR family regulator